MQNKQPEFCQFCGGPLEHRVPDADTRQRPVCIHCGQIVYAGPTVLVTVMVVAQDHLLLIKRGTPPYQNKWAPPGGFVEAGESLESAAIREVREETALDLPRDHLVPHRTLSLPHINQVYATFYAFLDRPQPLTPQPPEAIDAQWFCERTFPKREIWEPDRDLDVPRFFLAVRTRCLRFSPHGANAAQRIRPAPASGTGGGSSQRFDWCC